MQYNMPYQAQYQTKRYNTMQGEMSETVFNAKSDTLSDKE